MNAAQFACYWGAMACVRDQKIANVRAGLETDVMDWTYRRALEDMHRETVRIDIHDAEWSLRFGHKKYLTENIPDARDVLKQLRHRIAEMLEEV